MEMPRTACTVVVLPTAKSLVSDLVLITVSSLGVAAAHHSARGRGQVLSATCGNLDDMLETSARLLRLLSLLQTRRDWPGQTLAQRLEVSPRTVRRDVDRLRELGYPVQATKGPEGGYRLDAGTEMPPLLFDEEQAVAVAVALQTATTSVDGIAEPALRALATIRQVMPSRLRHRIDTLQVINVGRSRPRTTVSGSDLVAVSSAVRSAEVLRFDYGPDEARRRVEPHHLVMWGGRWYLVAWDLDRGDWRTFRVDRMRPRTPTGPHFRRRELPARDVATYISEKFASPGLPCRGELILHASTDLVTRYGGSSTVVEPLGPDRCRVTAASWSWIGLAAWAAMFDAEVEIVAPDELHVAAARLAARFGRATPTRVAAD
jgi:predicted DNA-binding transcriptional regulator YafY